MCDCFHLSFPNWHSPGTGPGRSLKGPEVNTEGDLVCEEPSEVLEEERPRPQGSSPIEEFPVAENYERRGEEDESANIKRGKRVGFGSLFERRTTAKMNQTEISEAGVIVETVKEACAEGLVLSGGGKDGIFITGVKPESPASKHLSVKEGDQIISATVYFDNMSYEDALQILEHAQPYKMEFCLKRKTPETTTSENAESIRPEVTTGKEGGSPKMRSRTMTKKQQDSRISWPKFPSFSKSHKAHFRRSHSTSEAEQKLEMSPPTSETESPLKSPLKSPDGKDKKKKHNVKLKMKLKGLRSKSVEQPPRDSEIPMSRNLEVTENQQTQQAMEVTEGPVTTVELISQIKDEKNKDSTNIINEYTYPSSPGPETQYKVELINLDKILKTTDISVTFAEDSPKGERERSERKVDMQRKQKSVTCPESKSFPKMLKELKVEVTSADSLAQGNVESCMASQIGVNEQQFQSDIKPETTEERQAKTLGYQETEMCMPTAEDSLNLFDTGLLRKSPKTGSEMQQTERTVLILESESYGIRTRGPLADIAISKAHFASNVNKLQFLSSDNSKSGSDLLLGVTETKEPTVQRTVTSQPEPNALEVSKTGRNADSSVALTVDIPGTYQDMRDLTLQSEKDTLTEPNFKLPKVNLSGHVPEEPIKMTVMGDIKTQLQKREDIEIPGMEDKTSEVQLGTSGIKMKNIIHDAEKIHAQRTEGEFSIEDVKEAVSKLPAFRLPDRDITGVLVHREIKTNVTPRGSPSKASGLMVGVGIKTPEKIAEIKGFAQEVRNKETMTMKLPKAEFPHSDGPESVALTELDLSRPNSEIPESAQSDEIMSMTYDRYSKFEIEHKLPKREDIEIPGMESIESSSVQMPEMKTKETSESLKKSEVPQVITASSADRLLVEERVLELQHIVPVQKSLSDAKIEVRDGGSINETSTSDKKEHYKKSKKTKVSMQSFGISNPDIRLPHIGIEFQRNESSKRQKIVEDKAEAQIIQVESCGENNLPMIEEAASPDLSLLSGKISSSKPDSDISLVNEAKPSDLADRPLLEQNAEAQMDIEKEITKKDINIETSPSKKRPLKFKMPKVGGKSGKSLPDGLEVKSDITITQLDIKEERVDIEKESTGVDLGLHSLNSDKHKSKLKMPNMDVSFPKVKIPKVEHKSQEEDSDPLKAEITVESSEYNASFKRSINTGEKKGPLDIKVEALENVKEENGIKLIKFGVSKVRPQKNPVKSKKESMTTSEIKNDSQETGLMVETKDVSSFDIKGSGAEIESQKVGVNKMEADDTEKWKSPKTDVSVAKLEAYITIPADQEIPSSDLKLTEPLEEGDLEIIEVEPKGTETKTKLRIAFPKFGFSKSQAKASDDDVTIPNVNVSIPEGCALKESEVSTKIPETELKGTPTVGSPTIFKVPSIKFPKFGVTESQHSSEAKDLNSVTKMSPTSADETPTEVKLTGPELLVLAEVEPDHTSVNMDVKTKEFGLDRIVAKPDVNTTLPEGEVQVLPPEIQVKNMSMKADEHISEIGRGQFEMKMKEINETSQISRLSEPQVIFPEADERHGIRISRADILSLGGKTDAKSTDLDMELEDFSGPKKSLEIKEAEIDIKIPQGDVKFKDKKTTGSPSKFKLPVLSLPKLSIITPKSNLGKAEFAADIKELDTKTSSEISQLSETSWSETGPEASTDVKTSKPKFSVDTKRVSTDTESSLIGEGIMAREAELDKQSHTTELSKSEIKIPKIKGDEVGVCARKEENYAVLEHKVEVISHDAAVQALSTEGYVEIPEVDAQQINVKVKSQRISVPKLGFSKPNVKASEVNVGPAKVDVNLSEGKVNISASEGKDKEKDIDLDVPECKPEIKEPAMFSSTTKFKLPTIKLPKFGLTAPKEHTVIDADIKGSEGEIPSDEIKEWGNLTGASVEMDLKVKGAVVESEGNKLKLQKSGIAPLRVKSSEADIRATEPKVDDSLTKENVGVHFADPKAADLKIQGKADAAELDSKGLQKPNFSIHKFGISVPDIRTTDANLHLPKVDVIVQQESVHVKELLIDTKDSDGVTGQKAPTTVGSPSKFKLPAIHFPKFGVRSSKGVIHMPSAGLDIKEPEFSLSESTVKMLGKDTKGPVVNIEGTSTDVKLKPEGVELRQEGSEFKLTNFGINFPKVKDTEIDKGTSKTETELREKVQPLDIEAHVTKTKQKLDTPETDTKGLDLKIKRPGFSFPKFSFSKSDIKVPDSDFRIPNVGVSVPEGTVDIKEPEEDIKGIGTETELKDLTTDGSLMKFKLPTIKFPKFGIAGKEVLDIPEKNTDLRKFDVDASGKAPSADIDQSTLNIKGQSVPVDQKSKELKGQESDIPLFGMALPQGKDTVADISVSVPKENVSLQEDRLHIQAPETQVGDVTVTKNVNIPRIDSKGLEVKMKKPSFTFPKIGFSRQGGKVEEVVRPSQLNVSIAEGEVIKEQEEHASVPDEEVKGPTMVVSPTKFKLPTLKLPKFGVTVSKECDDISDAEAAIKESKLRQPNARLSAEVPSTDIKGPVVNIKGPSGDVNVQAKELELETKLKLPRFRSDHLKGKGSETHVDVLLPEGNVGIQPTAEAATLGGKADKQKVDARKMDVKMKKPGFTFPKFGFSKQEIKTEEVFSPPQSDVSMLKDPTIDDTSLKSSQKLPTVELPKFDATTSKEVDNTIGMEPKLTQPDADSKRSAEVPSTDIRRPRTNMGVSLVDVAVKTDEAENDGSKLNLPKLGVTLSSLKTQSIDRSGSTQAAEISLPKMTAQLANAQVDSVIEEGETDVSEDSKGTDLKIKMPGFIFPKFRFSRSDVKAEEIAVSLPTKNDIKEPNTHIKVPESEMEVNDTTTVTSPSKFKLPTIKFANFGVTSTRGSAHVTDTDSNETKRPEVSLSESNIEMKGEKPSAKASNVDIGDDSMDTADVELEGPRSMFKMSKLGISLPRVKVPEVEKSTSKTEIQISLLAGKLEIQPSESVVQDDIVMKGDIPEVDSKSPAVKTKKPGFTFPKFGFSKADIKSPEVDTYVPKLDVSPSEGKMENNRAEEDTETLDCVVEVKDSTPVSSPTKFRLPTIKLPKLAVGIPKITGEATNTDIDIKEPDGVMHDAKEMISGEDIKSPRVDTETASSEMDQRVRGGEFEGEGTKFKLLKFGISLTKVKNPNMHIIVSKPEAEDDACHTEEEAEFRPSDIEAKSVPESSCYKAEEADVIQVQPKISLPKFGFSKALNKAPEVNNSLPRMEMSAQERNVDIKALDVDMKTTDTESRDDPVTGSPSKFKLSPFKMPKFGIMAPKLIVQASDIKSDITGTEAGSSDTNAVQSVNKELPEASDSKVILSESEPKAEVKTQTVDASGVPLENDGENEAGDSKSHGSPSKFKLPAFKIPKIGMSKTEDKENIQGLEKSSKFTLPTLGDVLRGFDVEFNVPKLDEAEASKLEIVSPSKQAVEIGVKARVSSDALPLQKEGEKPKFTISLPKLGFGQSTDNSSEAIAEEHEKPTESVEVQRVEADKEPTKTERGGWFKFPKFSSPTKTAKISEEESRKPTKEVKSPDTDNVEENVSLTLSVVSSDAFADISSAVTTEQTPSSLASPTKVAVKYAEHAAAAVEVGDTQVELITSTARTELIFMEPHQPEKVNIVSSSDMSSSSVDTLKQVSGQIHVIKSNVQASPDTQKATILTKFDTHAIQGSPFEHITISHETASSVRKLRDTVHTEKMKFFEAAETVKEITVMTSETNIRHVDSSTDENDGK